MDFVFRVFDAPLTRFFLFFAFATEATWGVGQVEKKGRSMILNFGVIVRDEPVDGPAGYDYVIGVDGVLVDNVDCVSILVLQFIFRHQGEGVLSLVIQIEQIQASLSVRRTVTSFYHTVADAVGV